MRKLERDSGVGERTINRWDTNMPAYDKVLAVAKYLNMSTDELAGVERNEKIPTTKNGEDLSGEQIELINDILTLTKEEQAVLLLFVKTFLSAH